MRVGIVIYGSLQSVSGGYLYDRKLVEHLRKRGDDVEVFSMPLHSYARHLTHNLSAQWLKRLARAQLDVLLQDELNHPSLFLLNRRLRPRVSYPVVSIVHHLRCREQWSFPARILYQAVESSYLTSVDGFVFNSKATRRSVEELCGGPRFGVVAHPGGNRLEPAMEKGEIVHRVRRDRPLNLAFVGNVISRKGLDDLLTALASLRHESWQLSVVGSLEVDVGYVATVRQRITTLGVDGKVRLLGSLTDGELTHLLKESDVIAMPFSYEGFGIVYLEGMAYGLPSLACRRGGAEEIVSHGENGYLFEPGDLSGLVHLLQRLLNNRDELLRLSLVARRRFDTFPSWEQTASTIRDFLVEAISSSSH